MQILPSVQALWAATCMPNWPGFSMVEENSHLPISFTDFEYLVKSYSPGEDCITSCFSPWGEAIKEQCCMHHPGSEIAVMRERMRGVARVLLHLLQELCFGTHDVIPHKSDQADIWGEAFCPIYPTKTSQGQQATIKTRYPEVWLGEKKWLQSGEREMIGISLHRLACWAARGPPPPDLESATHACGIKRCCRLDCLRWGDATSNAMDGYRQQDGRQRKR